MGEASEAFHDVMMLACISKQVIVAERGEELHRPFLSREMFAVFERHVEETSFRRLKLVVEASSAVALAAILQHREQFADRDVGVILSGGNVDLDALPWLSNPRG